MPYEIKWYLEPHVIFVRISGDVTAPEIETIFKELAQYAAQGTRPLFVVSDLSELGRYPINAAEYQKAVRALAGQIDTSILIGMSSPILKFISSFLSQISKYELRMVDTMDEALVLIERLQPGLLNQPAKKRA
jgi:hypothetical protein